jgi:hypothetical protein
VDSRTEFTLRAMPTSSDTSSVNVTPTLVYMIETDSSDDGSHSIYGAVVFTHDGTFSSRFTRDEQRKYEQDFPSEYKQASDPAHSLASNLEQRAAAASGEDDGDAASTLLTPEWLQKLVQEELQKARTLAEESGSTFGQFTAVQVTLDESLVL